MVNDKLVVACCGSFDGEIHPGHLNFLKEARNHGEIFYVFVVGDAIIRNNKQREPIYPLEQRIANLLSKDGSLQITPLSDDEEQNLEQVLSTKPDIYCFGPDQVTPWDQALKTRLELMGTTIKVIPRYKPEIYSTTRQLMQAKKEPDF